MAQDKDKNDQSKGHGAGDGRSQQAPGRRSGEEKWNRLCRGSQITFDEEEAFEIAHQDDHDENHAEAGDHTGDLDRTNVLNE